MPPDHLHDMRMQMADETIAPPITTRQEAIALGLKRYYTGEPCKYGHYAQRIARNSDCVVCGNLRGAKYAAANRPKRSAALAAWRAANPEKDKAIRVAWIAQNIDRHTAVASAWRAANPDKVQATQLKSRAKHKDERLKNTREWRAENREHVRVYNAEWRKKNKNYGKEYDRANPDKCRAKNNARRTRILIAKGSHSAEDIQSLFKAQKGKCAYCAVRVKTNYHVDHIMPLSKGGANWPANLQILCATCNIKKSAKDPIVFAQDIGLLL